MAGELLERAERIDRYILVLRDVLGVCFISVFMYWQSVPTARVGLRLDKIIGKRMSR
jgi:hypothetical protein